MFWFQGSYCSIITMTYERLEWPSQSMKTSVISPVKPCIVTVVHVPCTRHVHATCVLSQLLTHLGIFVMTNSTCDCKHTLAVVHCACRYVALRVFQPWADHLAPAKDRQPTNHGELKVTSHVKPHDEMAVTIWAAHWHEQLPHHYVWMVLLMHSIQVKSQVFKAELCP